MRKFSRGVLVAVLAILTTITLGIASAFMAALALGAATALIVPGTGTPDADSVIGYRENAADRYIAPFVRDAMDNPVCTSTNGCTLDGVDYPASFWPLGFIGNWCPGFQCDTWNESVGTGVANLDTAMHDALDHTKGDVILFGYSQGGAVVSNELRNLGDLTPDELSRLSVVMIGNAYNPDGGIFTRLGFLPTIPILNITFGPAMPTDTGVPITSIGFGYDPVMYAPKYWGNLFTMLNALAAFDTVHGYYLTPNENDPTAGMAYGYTDTELAAILAGPCPGPNCRVDSNGNKYYMIPAKSLPIVDEFMGLVPAPLQPVAKPVADLVSPVLKVLIDLGYDWSGDPGTEQWLSILPFNPIQNWPAVGINLVAATIQGIQAFISDLGGLAPTLAPAIQAPVSDPPVSTLAAATTPVASDPTDTGDTTDTADNKHSTAKLTLVKDSDTTVEQTTVETETKSESTEETPVTKPEPTVDENKTDETTADEKKAGETKAGETKVDDKKGDDKKGDDKKFDEKKVDNDQKSDTDNKDADTAKAAA